MKGAGSSLATKSTLGVISATRTSRLQSAEQQRTNSRISMVDTSLAISTKDINVQVERTKEALRLLLLLFLLLLFMIRAMMLTVMAVVVVHFCR